MDACVGFEEDGSSSGFAIIEEEVGISGGEGEIVGAGVGCKSEGVRMKKVAVLFGLKKLNFFEKHWSTEMYDKFK